MTTFHSPWAWFLLAAIPVVILLGRRRGRRAVVWFSSSVLLDDLPGTLRTRLWRIPIILRVLAMILLIVAIARPRKGSEWIEEHHEGIAMQIVIDRSSSMKEMMKFRGRKMSRFDVVRQISKEFILGNGRDLKGRKGDLIGLVTFARYTDIVCPLITDYDILSQFLDTIDVVTMRSEDGTAIGDAIAHAAASLKIAEEELKKRENSLKTSYKIKSKVIILLTDGENNAGRRTPEEGAAVARKWGIKLYCIAVTGERIGTIMDVFGNRINMPPPQINTETLEKAATMTGGKCWLATDASTLADIYKQIDKLEKSSVVSRKYVTYKERFMPFALGALLLLCVEGIFSRWILMGVT